MEQTGWGCEMVQAARDGRVSERELLKAAIDGRVRQKLDDVLVMTEFLLSIPESSCRRRYEVRMLRAESYADAERWSEAIPEYVAALEVAGEAAGSGQSSSGWELDVTLANLGYALVETGEAFRGLMVYTKAAELNPENETAQRLLGRHLLEQGMPRESIRYLIRAVRLRPDRTDTVLLLSNALRKVGKERLAEQIERRFAGGDGS